MHNLSCPRHPMQNQAGKVNADPLKLGNLTSIILSLCQNTCVIKLTVDINREDLVKMVVLSLVVLSEKI